MPTTQEILDEYLDNLPPRGTVDLEYLKQAAKELESDAKSLRELAEDLLEMETREAKIGRRMIPGYAIEIDGRAFFVHGFWRTCVYLDSVKAEKWIACCDSGGEWKIRAFKISRGKKVCGRPGLVEKEN